MQVISTAMWIGELKFRLLNGCNAKVVEVPRNDVKKWVFDDFPEICLPAIRKKIAKKGYKNSKTGEFRTPSFVFVDDKLVTEAMRELFKIKKPKPGKGYDFGLKDHGWQALATCAYVSKSVIQ